MTNALTTIAPEVAQQAATLPIPQAVFWLQIGNLKLDLDAKLLAIEQRFGAKVNELARAEGEATKAYQERLAAGLPELRKIADEAVESRKGYTTYLDRAKEACMKVEKLLAPTGNAEYVALAAKELELRKELATAAQAVQALENEKTAFRLHFVNEFDRLSAEMRQACATVASVAYTQALSTKMPVEGVPEWIKEHEAEILAITPGPPATFARKLLSQSDATAIYTTIPTIPIAAIREAAIADLHEKFSTYASDLANAEAAIAHEQESFEATIVEAAKEIEQTAAVNTLLATSQSFAVPVGPTVKVKEAIDTKGLTIPEATAIQAAFLLHGDRAWAKIRAKPEKLNTEQQAAALDAIDVRVGGVRYRRDEK